MRRPASQYEKYVALVQQFEMEYKNSKSGAVYDKMEFPKRYTVAPRRRFSIPDWSLIFTRQMAAMSEADYEEAIKKQALLDFNLDKQYASQAHAALFKNFVQCVSPDRIRIYNDSMQHTGGRMNATFKFFDDFGHTILRWNPFLDAWECAFTSLEKARIEIYKGIYQEKWENVKRGEIKPPSSSKLDIRG